MSRRRLERVGEDDHEGEALRDDRPRFDAEPSRHPGYTRLYDPLGGEWHDFPTRDCYPSIVELASKN